MIKGLASAADGVARLGGGALAEDPRRRSWISAGSFTVMAALTGLLAVAANSLQAGVLRAGSSTARELRSPQRYPSVPEHVGEDTYGRAFGFERCVHHLASVGGPLLAFAALALLGVRPALLVAVVPGLVAVAIGVWLLRRRSASGPARPARQPPRLQVRAVYSGRLGRLMTGITLFELANFAAVLLILRATRLLERQDVLFGAAAMAVLLYMLWRLAASGSWTARPASSRCVSSPRGRPAGRSRPPSTSASRRSRRFPCGGPHSGRSRRSAASVASPRPSELPSCGPCSGRSGGCCSRPR